MLECTVSSANLWKRLVDCINGLVNEANIDCSPGGLSIQAMDTSHVALVHLLLRGDGFASYQCERNDMIGLNLASLAKVLKVVDGADTLTMRRAAGTDTLILSTENRNRSKACEYQLKLMTLDTDAMGIPEMEYRSNVVLSSAEFAKIARDMAVFGDTITVDIDQSGVKFSCSGDVGEAVAFLRSATAADALRSQSKKSVKPEIKPELKGESGTVKPEPRGDDEEDDAPIASKFKAETETPSVGVEINLEEPVTLSFALRFMNIFAKGASLSDRVTLNFAPDSPCMIEYEIEKLGYLRYYLAPKVDEGEK
ncbi:proliferative cell nuclear antigen, putative [Bodo saltans]|uniref:DNA sliding clamp PCNA n=1 Tax=Bodo saltans TaxID=75058 RepID=A0A0S4JJ69_BODSA|nr:proliferative cell nuclear antigen, putative [Bodo saltans]|eukprot:CUG90592.1 proliferative cell nuclear antigen, putative [Bodo saltans]